ncbi:MAG TPA: hypothetical protein VIK18_04545 [Pirellulales bacterium]
MKKPALLLALVFAAGCAPVVPLNTQQVHAVFGNGAAFDCVQTPDRVEAWRIEFPREGPLADPTKLDTYVRLSDPVNVAPDVARNIAEVLNRSSTYSWDSHKTCQFLPGVQLRFAKQGQIVDVLLCFKCNELWVWHNHQRVGGQEFDSGRSDLAKLVKQIFPDDEEIQSL